MSEEDPLRNFKFTAEIGGRAVSLMKVSGLTIIKPSASCTRYGQLVLERGVFPTGDMPLHSWYTAGDKRDITITVDDSLQFHVLEANPYYLSFSDLDAGANNLMIETLQISYTDLSVGRLAGKH